MPSSNSSDAWRAETEAINREMERLILSAWSRTTEENQIRKFQFAALIERRNEAARHFLAESRYKPPEPRRGLQDHK
jgi:hypothetical protein